MRSIHWQCRLYGHDWRHPGDFEVVVTTESDPVHPLRCQRCSNVRLLDRNGDKWLLNEENGPSIHEEALEVGGTRDRR